MCYPATVSRFAHWRRRNGSGRSISQREPSLSLSGGVWTSSKWLRPRPPLRSRASFFHRVLSLAYANILGGRVAVSARGQLRGDRGRQADRQDELRLRCLQRPSWVGLLLKTSKNRIMAFAEAGIRRASDDTLIPIVASIIDGSMTGRYRFRPSSRQKETQAGGELYCSRTS